MSCYLDELFAPLDLLPVRYHRKPQQPPEPTPDTQQLSTETVAAKVRQAAHAAHELHQKMWNEFAAATARLVQPYPDLGVAIVELIKEFNARFAAPLAEVGWQT